MGHARKGLALTQPIEVDGLDQRANGLERPAELALGLLVEEHANDAAEHGVAVPQCPLHAGRVEALRTARSGEQHRVGAHLRERVRHLISGAIGEERALELRGGLRHLGGSVAQLSADGIPEHGTERSELVGEGRQARRRDRSPREEAGEQGEEPRRLVGVGLLTLVTRVEAEAEHLALTDAGAVEAEARSVGVQEVGQVAEALPLAAIVCLAEGVDIGAHARSLRLDVTDQERPVSDTEVWAADLSLVWLPEKIDAGASTAGRQRLQEIGNEIRQERLRRLGRASSEARLENAQMASDRHGRRRSARQALGQTVSSCCSVRPFLSSTASSPSTSACNADSNRLKAATKRGWPPSSASSDALRETCLASSSAASTTAST
jgi:hypothetical protein